MVYYYSFFVSILLFLLPSLQGSQIASGRIDLGAVPIGEKVELAVNLPPVEGSVWLTEVESSCPCLEVSQFPETLETGLNLLNIHFKAEAIGAADLTLTFIGFDTENEVPFRQVLPVITTGFEPVAATTLPKTIEPLLPNHVYSKKRYYQIIDIRGVNAYNKVHIEGSLEYSLDSYVALADKFKRPVVLVGDGLLSSHQVDILEQLVSTGKSVFWLQGGLPGWVRQGRPVEGVWPSKVSSATITLQRWLESGGASGGWQVVDLSGGLKNWPTFLGQKLHRLDAEQKSSMKLLLQKIQEAALRSIESKGILIVGDSKGMGYPMVEAYVDRQNDVPVYYLRGGSDAVSAWIQFDSSSDSSGIQSYTYTTSQGALSVPGIAPRINSGRRRGCSSCPGR